MMVLSQNQMLSHPNHNRAWPAQVCLLASQRVAVVICERSCEVNICLCVCASPESLHQRVVGRAADSKREGHRLSPAEKMPMSFGLESWLWFGSGHVIEALSSGATARSEMINVSSITACRQPTMLKTGLNVTRRDDRSPLEWR